MGSGQGVGSMKTFFYVKTEREIFGRPKVEIYLEQAERIPKNSLIIIGNLITSKDYFETLELANIFADLRRAI
jgi:hypothetical protein